MKWYLAQNNILCKHYEDHVKAVSQKVKKAALAPLQQQKLLVQHVYGKDDKEQIARAFAVERHITEGDVCALTTMEMAPTFQHEKKDMAVRSRPCLTVYRYRIDPELGFMHARIQTWFPFCVHVCINGREWLARRMDREGLHYVRQENGFPWIEDVPRAQQLMDEQLKVNWAERRQPFADRLNPLHEEIFRNFPTPYYWTAFPCEWATDMMFRPGTLSRLAPLLWEHGMLSFSSADVLQFLGHRIHVSGEIPLHYNGELTSDFKRRATGDRIKYRVDGNSLKGYGKAIIPVGEVFRVEATTQNVEVFQVLRPKEGSPESSEAEGPEAEGSQKDLPWRRMRRGVADRHRRAEVSPKANERYWDALSTVDDSTRFCELTRDLEKRCRYKERSVRALHPFQSDDHGLLQAVNHGEFTINGFRNRDLQLLLYGPVNPQAPLTKAEQRRRAAAVSRKLRILHVHGLVHRVQKTHRYQVTQRGRLVITAVITMDRTSIAQLNQVAA
jgi:hypothetical protein